MKEEDSGIRAVSNPEIIGYKLLKEDDGSFYLPSYKNPTCCRNADCYKWWNNTPEDPCWGELGPIDEYGSDDDWGWVHGCEGHTSVYADRDYNGQYTKTDRKEDL